MIATVDDGGTVLIGETFVDVVSLSDATLTGESIVGVVSFSGTRGRLVFKVLMPGEDEAALPELVSTPELIARGLKGCSRARFLG